MNDVIRSLAMRKSVRDFLPKPIGSEEREAILQSAFQAPTAGNQQLYTILEITDPALKQRLSETCDHQPFIAAAPMALVFCADAQKWYDGYEAAGCEPREPGPGDLMLCVQDAVIAAQNAVTAAWSLGIGSCYIGDMMENCEEHRALLNLPPFVFPATMVVFGYPTAKQLERRKPERYPEADMVMENRYARRDGITMAQELGAHSLGKPPIEWLRAFCARKYQSTFAREMNRSVREYLKPFLSGREQPGPDA